MNKYLIKTKHRNSGFTLIECLVSILIFSLIATTSLGAISYLYKTRLELSKKERHYQTITDLEIEFQNLIFKSEKIENISLLGLNTSSSDVDLPKSFIRAKPGISAVILDFNNSVEVVSTKCKTALCKLVACCFDKLSCHIKLNSYYLGLSLDSFSLYKPIKQKKISTNFCPNNKALELELFVDKEGKTNNLIFEALNLNQSETNPLNLIPIENSVTLYLDKPETIYFYSALTKEKQPLINGVKSLNIDCKKQSTYLAICEVKVRTSLFPEISEQFNFPILRTTKNLEEVIL